MQALRPHHLRPRGRPFATNPRGSWAIRFWWCFLRGTGGLRSLPRLRPAAPSAGATKLHRHQTAPRWRPGGSGALVPAAQSGGRGMHAWEGKRRRRPARRPRSPFGRRRTACLEPRRLHDRRGAARAAAGRRAEDVPGARRGQPELGAGGGVGAVGARPARRPIAIILWAVLRASSQLTSAEPPAYQAHVGCALTTPRKPNGIADCGVTCFPGEACI